MHISDLDVGVFFEVFPQAEDGEGRIDHNTLCTKMDVAANVKLLQNKGSLSLRVTDIFYTFRYENRLQGLDFEEYSHSRGLTRAAFLSFTYRFEKGESAKRRNRKKRSFNEPGARE